jgi:hypothetical protein
MQSVYTIDGNDFYKYDHELDWSGKLFEQYDEVAPIRNQGGIYAFTICGEIVYIGSSRNLFNRFQTHIGHMHGKTNQSSSSMENKKYYYLKKYLPYVQFHILRFLDKPVFKYQLEECEYDFINKHSPIFNINYKNGQRRWNDSEQDLDNFVNGIVSMDDLKMKSNTTK